MRGGGGNGMGRMGGLQKVDGPAPSQASITLSVGLEAVPTIPRKGPNGHYPRGCSGTASASTVLRDDLLFTRVDSNQLLTSTGISAYGCKASMGNETRPEPGGEDDWCAEWGFVGLAKNSLTNPEDGNFSATGGDQRASSVMEAVQTAGSHSVKYTGRDPIFAGQLIIFHPPPVDGDYDRRNSRPTPILGPLDWTRMVTNPLHSIDVTMCSMQSYGVHGNETLDSDRLLDDDHFTQGSGGRDTINPTWEDAALQRKRSILTQGAALVSILAKRGYVKIMDVEKSWADACHEKYMAKLEKMSNDAGADGNKFKAAHQEYKKELSDGWQQHNDANWEYTDRERRVWCYDRLNEKIESLDLNEYPNIIQQFLVPREVKMHQDHDSIINDFQEVERSLAWILRILGLGEESSSQEHFLTVLEVLRMCSKGALDPSDTQDLVVTANEMFSGKGSSEDDVEDTMAAFRRHLDNHETGLTSTIMKIQHKINRRIVGISMSTVPPVNQNMPGNTDPVLDLILGMRTVGC